MNSYLPFFLPLSSLPLPFPHSRFHSLSSLPPNPARGDLVKRCKLPQWGPVQSPGHKRILTHLRVSKLTSLQHLSVVYTQWKKVKADIASWEPHLRATGRHLPYGITQCYLSPDTSERAPSNPSHAGWYSIYLPQTMNANDCFDFWSLEFAVGLVWIIPVFCFHPQRFPLALDAPAV